MKRFLMLLMVAITCVSFMSSMAEAKRLGGGSSFGKSRPAPTKQSQRAPEATPKPAQSGASKWLGPLAGLAVGAALASMFSGSGMGDAMGSILIALAIAAAVMFLISRFRKPQLPNMQYAGVGNAYQTPSTEPVLTSGSQTRSTNEVPHDFPVDSFLRNAKASFIRLQAANDRKDINDIREYTTPEVFAEISMQMQERGNSVQTTEVVAINADLLEVVNEDAHTIASVRFTGQLRENNGALESIDEVWYIQKSASNAQDKWLLAGIQQLN